MASLTKYLSSTKLRSFWPHKTVVQVSVINKSTESTMDHSDSCWWTPTMAHGSVQIYTLADARQLLRARELQLQGTHLQKWQHTYSVDRPAAEKRSAQCRPSVFLATLTTTSIYSEKFRSRSHVFSKRDFFGDSLFCGSWFFEALGLQLAKWPIRKRSWFII